MTSKQGTTTGAVSLTVWNFSLPAAPALKSSFLFFQSGTRAAQAELLRNKISPASGNPADQAALKEYGLSVANTGPFSGADVGRCNMSPAPSASHFKALAATQQPGLFLYDYSADEIGHCSNLYPMIKQWAANMHQAGIKNLISMSPTPALYDDGTGSGRSAVDIWVVLPVMYNNNKAAIEQVLQKGDEVWSYNTLVQDAYSPKWLIDFDPINFRIQPGFLNPRPQADRPALLEGRSLPVRSLEQREQHRHLRLGQLPWRWDAGLSRQRRGGLGRSGLDAARSGCVTGWRITTTCRS